MNEIIENVVTIIVILYDLNEKNKFENEKLNLNRSKMFLKKYESKKNQKKFSIKFIIVQSNIIKRIVKTYFNDMTFQRIIQNKNKKTIV